MEQARDIAVIQRVKEGDNEAFGELVDRYKDLIYTLSLRMMGNAADAEEAAQESFVKAFQSLHHFQQKARFSTWLYRITYNHCISSLRSRVKLFDLVDELPEEEDRAVEGDGFEKLSRDDRSRWLREAMEALAETDAVVLTLFYYEELSLDEIAGITGLSDSNVRVRLHRARKRLGHELGLKLKKELTTIL